MNASYFILLSALIVICGSQRSPYAGRRPIGFPIVETTTSANAQNGSLGNRFDTLENGTTQRIPVEALGDRDLINRLGKLPQDKQPFWFINWQALEQHRQKPQSYPLRPSSFIGHPILPDPPVTAQTNQVPAQTNQVPMQTNQIPAQINQVPVQTNQVPSLTNQIRAQTNQVSTQIDQVSVQTNRNASSI